MFENLAGGLVPTFRVERTVHVVDGTSYKLGVTWARRAFDFEYHTPRHPRGVWRARAAEAARVRAASNARLAELGAHHLIK